MGETQEAYSVAYLLQVVKINGSATQTVVSVVVSCYSLTGIAIKNSCYLLFMIFLPTVVFSKLPMLSK